MSQVKETEKSYGYLWKKDKKAPLLAVWHFTYMQEVVNESIVRGLTGIDVGSGGGQDTYIMAKNNPHVEIVSVDLSDGIYEAKEVNSTLKNVRMIKCSVLDMPLKTDTFDFAYSFGVLHHTPNPQKGLMEIIRILKKEAPVFLYLYEDHSENLIKYIAVKIVSLLRIATVRIPSKLFYGACYIFSPLVFVIFTIPSKILRLFKATRHFAGRIPFNFGRGPFSLRGDLYDRFRTPLEHRFSRQGVYNLLNKCGLHNIKITRLKDKAGWVAWGYKG